MALAGACAITSEKLFCYKDPDMAVVRESIKSAEKLLAKLKREIKDESNS